MDLKDIKIVDLKEEEVSEKDIKTLDMLRRIYKHTDDFIDVFENLGIGDKVPDIIFKDSNGNDVMEDKINNFMSVLYSIFINEDIFIEDNDIKGISGLSGLADKKIGNKYKIEGKRIPLGFSKYNKSNFSINTLKTEIGNQLKKYNKRPYHADFISFFVPLCLDSLKDFNTIENLLNDLVLEYKWYLDNIFNDICFVFNLGKNQNNEKKELYEGKFCFVSLKNRINRCFKFSIFHTEFSRKTGNLDEADGKILYTITEPVVTINMDFYGEEGTINFLNVENENSKSVSFEYNNRKEKCNTYFYGTVLLSQVYMGYILHNFERSLVLNKNIIETFCILYERKYKKELKKQPVLKVFRKEEGNLCFLITNNMII